MQAPDRKKLDAPLPLDHHRALSIYESDMGRAREREGVGERGPLHRVQVILDEQVMNYCTGYGG